MTTNWGQSKSGLIIPAKEVADFHNNSDVDSGQLAQHHTLGPGPNQAAPGNHNHHEKINNLDVALLNNWRAYSPGTWGTPGLFERYGRVDLVGLVDPSAAATNTIMNLPVGYRPGRLLMFTCSGLNSAGTAIIPVAINVYANGDVVRDGSAAQTQYITLANCQFEAVDY